MVRGVYVTHANGRSDATSSGDANRGSNGRADHASSHTIRGRAIGYANSRANGNPRAYDRTNGNRRTAARNGDGAAADRRADAACCHFSTHAASNARATACAARNTRAGAFVACNARADLFAPRNRGNRHGRARAFTAHDRRASADAVRYAARNG